MVTAQSGDYTTCPTFALLTSRGCCDSRLNSYWTGPMARSVLSQLKGGIHYETDYNSDLDRDHPQGALFAANVVAGANTLTDYALTLTLKCPNTKIAMLGYSLGSFVQGGVLYLIKIGNRLTLSFSHFASDCSK